MVAALSPALTVTVAESFFSTLFWSQESVSWLDSSSFSALTKLSPAISYVHSVFVFTSNTTFPPRLLKAMLPLTLSSEVNKVFLETSAKVAFGSLPFSPGTGFW